MDDDSLRLLEARVAALEGRVGSAAEALAGGVPSGGDDGRGAGEAGSEKGASAAAAAAAGTVPTLRAQVEALTAAVATLEQSNPAVAEFLAELDRARPLLKELGQSPSVRAGTRERVALVAAGSDRIKSTATLLQNLEQLTKWANADELADVPQLERQFSGGSNSAVALHAQQTAAVLALENQTREALEQSQEAVGATNTQLLAWDSQLTRWEEQLSRLLET